MRLYIIECECPYDGGYMLAEYDENHTRHIRYFRSKAKAEKVAYAWKKAHDAFIIKHEDKDNIPGLDYSLSSARVCEVNLRIE